jgi:hypothetical protein
MIKSIFRVFYNQYRLFSLDQKNPRTFTQVWLEKFYQENPQFNPNKNKKPKRKKTRKKRNN